MKNKKSIEDQGENQVQTVKEYGKQIIESTEISKNNFNIDRERVSHGKKYIFNKLVNERLLKFDK